MAYTSRSQCTTEGYIVRGKAGRESRGKTKDTTRASSDKLCSLALLASSLVQFRNTCPGSGTTHSGLGSPTPIKTNPHRPTYKGNCSRQKFFLGDSSLCQFDS